MKNQMCPRYSPEDMAIIDQAIQHEIMKHQLEEFTDEELVKLNNIIIGGVEE